MASEIETQKNQILETVGTEAVDILQSSGIEVENGIVKVLLEKQETRQRLQAEAESDDVTNMMTSELVYRGDSLGDQFGQEYSRRLSLLGFEDEVIEGLYSTEATVIASGEEMLQAHREVPWTQRIFFDPTSTTDGLPKPEELTLSELILITDDANGAYRTAFKTWSTEAFAAISTAITTGMGDAKYAKAFNERSEDLSFSGWQNSRYTRNECLLTERLKWAYGDKPAWTEDTTRS